jgi:2-oxoglutarate ferredoxin oxidoreductase subunit gamma
VPSTEIAQENSLTGMANIVLLGKVIKECEDRLIGINLDSIAATLEKIIPPKKKALVEKNTEALRIGYGIE